MNDSVHEDEFLSFFNDEEDFDMDFDTQVDDSNPAANDGDIVDTIFSKNAPLAKDEDYCSDNSSHSTVSDSSYSTQSSHTYPPAQEYYQRTAPDPRSPETDTGAGTGDDSDVSVSSYDSSEPSLVRPRNGFIHARGLSEQQKRGIMIASNNNSNLNPSVNNRHNPTNIRPMPQIPFMNMPCDPNFVMGAGSQFPLAVPILPIQKMQKQQPLQPPPQSCSGVKIEQTSPTTNKVETAKRQRKEERLMKNRESATQSRLRRKHEYENMKVYVKELEEKIHSLENSLASSHTECKSLREQNAFLQDMIRKQFDVTHAAKGFPAQDARPEVEEALNQNMNPSAPVEIVTGTLPRFVTEAGDKGTSVTGKKRGIDATSTPEEASFTRKTPFVKISPGMMMTVAVMFCLASCLTPSSDSTNESITSVPYVGRNVLASQSSNLTSSMVDMWQFTANVLFNFVFLGVFGVGVSTLYTFFTSEYIEGHLQFDANIRSMLPSFMLSMGKTKHS